MSELPRNVDLNSASADELEHIGGLGHEKAEKVVENRPIRSWDDLKQIEGFSDEFVEDLREAGVTLGGAQTDEEAA
jgi:DNA uptake protein ComE-like DNA-binding protein